MENTKVNGNGQFNCQETKNGFNPWLMANIEKMQYQTMNTPTGWLEWDND